MAGLYLHIPFCKRRCIYCDFFSTTQSEKKTTYVSSLCRELEMRKDYIGGETIETIYFGGGTPSQLSQEDFISIFSELLSEMFSECAGVAITYHFGYFLNGISVLHN